MTLEKFRRQYRRSQQLAAIAIAGSEWLGARLQRAALRFLTLRARYRIRWRFVKACMSEAERAAADEIDEELRRDEFTRSALEVMREAAKEMPQS